MATAGHLVKRGITSLVPVGPKRVDDAWAREQLLERERDLWDRMSRTDRRHAVGVARRVHDALGERATRPVLAAALLHDVGKVEARFGVYLRTMATLSGLAVKHDPSVIEAWTRTTGITRRVGLYLQHDRLGGDLLGVAGSDPLTESWAREHHRPEAEWTVPVEIGRALKDADDD